MKIVIVNTLVLILIFNLIMIIFPEGKTQKFCRISVKILIIVYILDNIFLSGSISLTAFQSREAPTYEREVSVRAINPQIIDSINQMFEGEEVVNNITLSFSDDMEVHGVVLLRKIPGNDELIKLKEKIAEIFQLKDNIDFIYGGLYE